MVSPLSPRVTFFILATDTRRWTHHRDGYPEFPPPPDCKQKVLFCDTVSVFWHRLPLKRSRTWLPSHFHKLTIFLLCLHRLQQRASIGKSAPLMHHKFSPMLKNSNPSSHTCCRKAPDSFECDSLGAYKVYISVSVCVCVHRVGTCLHVRLLAFMQTDRICLVWIISGTACVWLWLRIKVSWWQQRVCVCDGIRVSENEWRTATCKSDFWQMR